MTCPGYLAKHDGETVLPRRNEGWLMVDCVSKGWSRNAPAYHDSRWLAFRSVHIRRTRQVGTQEGWAGRGLLASCGRYKPQKVSVFGQLGQITDLNVAFRGRIMAENASLDGSVS